MTAGLAQAAVLDLNIGGANAYSLGNFSSSSGKVGGALLVAGNMDVSNYSVNGQNKDAYGNSALAVGGDLNYRSGSINNGSYHAGGVSNIGKSMLNDASPSDSSPLSFEQTSAQLKELSTSLSQVKSIYYSWHHSAYDLTLTGSGSGNVQIFNIPSHTLYGQKDYKFEFNKLNPNDTLILNISGAWGGFSDANLIGFGNYNVLFNFYEATELWVPQNLNLKGNILAPLATVNGGRGTINGNVVVGNWNSNIDILGNNAFKPADVPGLISPVPEPESYAMWLAGLGLLGCVARRKAGRGKQAAACMS
ncbi:choice-of-anchor A family protein [Janthinobacterium agaricidamnosum]|uniref:choice-of-anchor A family protein n=1 Tax=Janthinobacterium agaricidamnosum TaxID=55508 RepID=UPI00142F33C6|nr:choice-of-anchor A family protein [Janthinobacterium agaricidamnosum]